MFSILIIFSLTALASSVKLHCNLIPLDIPQLQNGNVVKCKVTSYKVVLKERATIEDILMTNKQPNNSIKMEEIIGFEQSVGIVFYIPSGIEKIFKTLIYFRLAYCQLQEVTHQDLKAYPKLKHLNLEGNEIAVLEKDLFKYNLDLMAIILNTNRIRSINLQIFDDLKNIQLVDLQFNGCMSGKADGIEQIERIIEIMKKHCQKVNENESLDEKSKNFNEIWWILVACAGIVVLIGLTFVIYKLYQRKKGNESEN